MRRGGGHVGLPSDRPPLVGPALGPGLGAGLGPFPVSAGSVQDVQQQLPQASLYPDPHFMPIATAADVAASAANAQAGGAAVGGGGGGGSQPTKKTRTKPIRNADGVLIRKDGRPDMRSVSSAMNLKKVHAKKEAERQSKEASTEDKDRDTPHSDGEQGSASSPGQRDGDSESEDEEEDRDGQEEDPRDRAEREKHEANMRRIFPYGIDGGPQSARNMAQAFFPPVSEARAPPEVKIEAAGAGAATHADRDSAVPSRERTSERGRERIVDGSGGGAAEVLAVAGGVGAGAGTANNGVVEERRDVEMSEAGPA